MSVLGAPFGGPQMEKPTLQRDYVQFEMLWYVLYVYTPSRKVIYDNFPQRDSFPGFGIYGLIFRV